ncbi:MAG: hypothetical protein ACP5XB_24735 [Isosphaeraceae bacterium]
MNKQVETEFLTSEGLAWLEDSIKCRLGGRVHDFHILFREQGLVLRGHSHTYYVKQLAQHAVMESVGLPIWANEISVS